MDITLRIFVLKWVFIGSLLLIMIIINNKQKKSINSRRTKYKKYNCNFEKLKNIGETFEKEISLLLSQNCYEVFHNFVFYDEDTGEKVQIDIICISKSKIFIIECKNWSGVAIGNSNWNRWIYSHTFKPFGKYGQKDISYQVHEVGNPIKQNIRQCNLFKKLIRNHHMSGQSIYGVVVFSNKNSLLGISACDDYITYKENLLYFLNSNFDNPLEIDNIDIEKIKLFINTYK